METTPKARRDRRRRRRLLAFLTVAMMGGSVMTASLSLAAFNSTATAAGTFSAGSVKITANGQNDDDTVTPATITFTGANKMKPGDTVSGKVLVVNAGTLDMTYGIGLTTAATGSTVDLATTLNLVISQVPGNGTCPATAPGSGLLYSGALTTGTTLFTARPLTVATGQETLCMFVTFPNGTPTHDNAYKGAGTTATFKFTGIQS